MNIFFLSFSLDFFLSFSVLSFIRSFFIYKTVGSTAMTSSSIIKQAFALLLFWSIIKETKQCPPTRAPPTCSRRNCDVSSWSGWSDCTSRCGNTGMKARTRSKTVGESCGGVCPYQLRQSHGCNRDACQNGGQPANGYCRCSAEFAGTCCENGEQVI